MRDDKHNAKQGGLFFLGLFVAFGLALAGYFVSETLVKSKVAINTADVKGLAERRVKADRANWSIGFSVAAKERSHLSSLYTLAESQQDKIVAVLEENGFSGDEISSGALDYQYYEYRNDDQQVTDRTYSLRGQVSVETAQVDKIAPVRGQISKLVAEGINIENMAPLYRFTGLNDIKPEMLREATQNARLAAVEFAENAGVKVGGIRSAAQGGFNIRDAGEEYGDTAKIDKDVRVVTNITFYLTE